ncbi:MAG: aminopeptidase [Candidatus Hodarchaeales archaeon]
MSDQKQDNSEKEPDFTYELKNAWEKHDKEGRQKVIEFATDYMKWLDTCKTERETFKSIVSRAKTLGFKEFEKGMSIQPGDKLIFKNRKKNAILVQIGQQPLDKGVRIIGSHIDAPRIDLKGRPLYEDSGLALFRTHYYGGVKKYQWVNIPLALYGKVILADGKEVDIAIGDDPDDPVFTISDLLPHLARKAQGKRTTGEVIKGEELIVIAGSLPLIKEKKEGKDSKAKPSKDKIKKNLLKILNEKYGIIEEDFISAEIEVVPAGKCRWIGFDKGLLGGYGHDDRSCTYATFRALVDMDNVPEYTSIALFMDKEEIGSDTNTGAKSAFLKYSIVSLLEASGKASYGDIADALTNSQVISADVNAAINPVFKSVHEESNAAKIGHGICVTKFTGAGGKYSSNDAHAEFIAKIRRVFNENNVSWQIGELGKVDEGGGGTIAKFLAELNCDVIDIGIPIIGMHSPFELLHIADLYAGYKGYKAFYEDKK